MYRHTGRPRPVIYWRFEQDGRGTRQELPTSITVAKTIPLQDLALEVTFGDDETREVVGVPFEMIFRLECAANAMGR